jgi:hypothetical protein
MSDYRKEERAMKNTTKALTILMGVLLLAVLIPAIGYAAVPQQITYQGQLTDTEGNPVPDGGYEMSFGIYNVPTGGTALWSEAQTVTVINGIYTVILGQSGNELDPTDFDGDLYLGVTLTPDSEMTPRQPITSVGYALRAQVADTVKEGAVTTVMLQDAAVDTTKVADNAITESKLGDATVTTVKIQDGATLSEIIDDDGTDSGLDADLFDGYDSSAFMPAGVDNWVDEAGDTMSGKLEISVPSGEGLSSTTASTVNYTSAIKGYASATNAYTYGVYGQSDSPLGAGVRGYASATTGDARGVYGRSESTSGRGVYGWATASSGDARGVYGKSDSTDGYGVFGYASATTGDARGVLGRSDSTDGRGIYGYASASTGTTYGVYGQSNSPSGWDFWAGGQGNYGPFTGAHEAKLSEGFPEEVEPGLIVAATGQAQIRQNPDGSVNLSSTLPTVKLADRANDKTVFGVLVSETTLPEDHWYEAAEGERFASVNALGEGRVWVSNSNGSIEAGDYITTSAIPGYGQKQNDDLLHSYTLGKAIETVDWDQVTETVEFNGMTYKVYLLAVVYTSG